MPLFCYSPFWVYYLFSPLRQVFTHHPFSFSPVTKLFFFTLFSGASRPLLPFTFPSPGRLLRPLSSQLLFFFFLSFLMLRTWRMECPLASGIQYSPFLFISLSFNQVCPRDTSMRSWCVSGAFVLRSTEQFSPLLS